MRRIAVFTLSLAVTVAFAAGAPGWRRIDEPLAQRGTSTEPRFDAFHRAFAEQMIPQFRAVEVLQMAVNGYDGAAEYLIANARSWRGEIEPTASLEAMLETAMSSPRLDVRMAAIEVSLARSELEVTAAQVDALLEQRGQDREWSNWELWSVAAIGARGVDREHIYGVLLEAVHDADAKERHYAVDALAVFGGTEVIAPLLAIAANDPDESVQERAFCGLAQSATLHIAEREGALPGLLAIASDIHASAQQHDWSYQAMREISGLAGIAEDPVAWQRALRDAGLLPVAR